MRRSLLSGLLGSLLVFTGAWPASAWAPARIADADTTTATVPITSRAVAWVMLQHAPTTTTVREAMWTNKWATLRGVRGAELRYGGDGEYDGHLLRAYVTPDIGKRSGCDEHVRCAVLSAPGEPRVVLVWQEEMPEEDPGIVFVVAEHSEAGVESDTVAYYSGEPITRDPRKLDLEVDVQTLVDIAVDPRLRPSTSPDVVAAGETVTDWEGGEQDPTQWDIVPSTDRAQVAALLLAQGGYGYYRRARVSPLKARFGSRALGGRIDRRLIVEGDPSRLDIIAAPRRPGWLPRNPCRRFTRCVRTEHRRGPIFLWWRPGAGGYVWAVQRRADQWIAMRTAPRREPVARTLREVRLQVDWWSSVRFAVTNKYVGLTTERRVLDFSAEHFGKP